MGSSQSKNKTGKGTKLMNDAQSQNTLILQHGCLDIQFGLGGSIKSRHVIISQSSLQIDDDDANEEKDDDEDEKSLHVRSVSLSFAKLLNIDDACILSRSHSFQLLFDDASYPSVHVYCRTASAKRAWLQTCIQLCPRFILTKELQTVKECATNCGFSDAEIEAGLARYHTKYGTVYNVDVFVSLLQNDDSDTVQGSNYDAEDDDDDDAVVPSDLQCAICHQLYTLPVRNVYGMTYCRDCIASWFDMIKRPEQTDICDPYTRQKLPLHCRLLMPYFTRMAKVWNHTHATQREMPVQVITELKQIDDKMNGHRENILRHLQKSADIEGMSQTLTERFMNSEKYILHAHDMDDVISEALQCHQWLLQLQACIEQGSKIYNHAMLRVGLPSNNHHNQDVFKWHEPQWKNCIDKSAINWTDIYQIDETLQNELYEHTTECVQQISSLMKTQKSLNVADLKQKILKIVVQKQTAIMNEARTEYRTRCNAKLKKNHKRKPKLHRNPKIRKNRISVQRIMYTENRGLVHTRCIRDIAECLQNKRAFELYHNDLQQKTMKRDFLVRFLNTSGWNGVEYQHYLYDCFAMRMKDKMLRLCAHLKTTRKRSDKVQYFRHLKKVEVVSQKVLHPTQWRDDNDCVQLRVKFDLDFDAHLAQYNGDKQALAHAIKQQMLKQLKLKQAVLADANINVTEIKKGSIDVVVVFSHPLPAVIGLAGGLLHCGVSLYRHFTDANYFIPTKHAVMQGAAVGGGIGACAGAAVASQAGAAVGVAALAALGPIGAIVGCAIAGAVVGGLLGWGVWSLLKRWKRQTQQQAQQSPQQAPQPQPTQDDDDDDDNGGGDDCKHDQMDQAADNASDVHEGFPIRMLHAVDINIGEIERRIQRNAVNSEYEMRLDCGCLLPYDDESVGTEGGWYYCPTHREYTEVATMEYHIQRIWDGNGQDRRQAMIRSVHIPLDASNEFDVESDSEREDDV